ncbi:rRNA maturation RNase YbeY [Thiolapillus sp.]|uniref:rRNA maturation RNase YbeY n=1 Tax=Thiolapillus sp. TaxID=2017437 RepID=UPI0025EB1F63|nr:rRNA maturation RNase YbeY [Thiolapillus sp.]
MALLRWTSPAMIRAEIQTVCQSGNIPDSDEFQTWLEAVFPQCDEAMEIVIRIVDERESAALNAQYRHKQGPTNVLSFPFQPPVEMDVRLLGDLVICAPLVAREAREQNKNIQDHWAHLVVHGVLHLLGFDHLEEQQARQMEAKEVAILKKLAIPDPYQ